MSFNTNRDLFFYRVEVELVKTELPLKTRTSVERGLLFLDASINDCRIFPVASKKSRCLSCMLLKLEALTVQYKKINFF